MDYYTRKAPKGIEIRAVLSSRFVATVRTQPEADALLSALRERKAMDTARVTNGKVHMPPVKSDKAVRATPVAAAEV